MERIRESSKTALMTGLSVLIGLVVAVAQASVYDELMPMPRLAVDLGGCVELAALSSPEAVLGSVAGAPSNVVAQAYSLELLRDKVRIVAGGAAGDDLGEIVAQLVPPNHKTGILPIHGFTSTLHI